MYRLQSCTGQKGGEETGPSPVDRGKPGSKHHLAVDCNGIPLTVGLTAANLHDSREFENLLDTLPRFRNKRGRPTWKPDKVHADKGYDFEKCRFACIRRWIRPRIARRGIESSERLGRYRWVVERTISWLHRFRRLTVRYERRADIHSAFLFLGAALICYSSLVG